MLGALLGVPRAALECAAVDAVTMTKAEAELHNEINAKHLNSKMGKEMFTMTDAMVRLCDLQQLVIFLKFCQRRLAGQEVVAAGRCGFKRIQAEEAIRLQKEQIERERLRKENELRAIQVCTCYCCCSVIIECFLHYRTVTGSTRSTSWSTVP